MQDFTSRKSWLRSAARGACSAILSGVLLSVVPATVVIADDPVLVRVATRTSRSQVGMLISEDADQVTLQDLDNGQEISISRTDVVRITNPLSLDDAASSVGLATIAGWKISQLASQERPSGKIAQVTPQVVYVTLGENHGVRAGRKLFVYRNKGEIKDPDTGVVLAVERPKIAELEIVELNPAFSKAKITSDLEVLLAIGDEVEPDGSELRIAVCPLLNEDGTLTNVGAGIAEDMTTRLVQRKITVVERAVMDMVLGELLVQNTVLFDQSSAQKLGKLTGANAVLTGKIVPDRNTGKAYVRLIDVQTGKILFAVSSSVSLSGARPVARMEDRPGRSPGSSENSGSSTPPSSKSRIAQAGKLGAARTLPRFLTTEGNYQRTADKGVRLPGFDSFSIRDVNSVRTRQTDYLNKDFTFELLLTFAPGDRIAYIGIGPGRPDRSYNGLTDSVYLRFHAPDLADGLVDVTGFRKGHDTMGKISHGGNHRVKIIKEGDSVTFLVDPEDDGASDDDMELTIANIRDYAPFFNSKNMPIFFGGSGTFLDVSISE